jgi:alpha-tubulin suppressor-like RCC1 family protein
LTKKFLDVKLDKENGYALADDGEVWVWGVNSNGELGLSDY